ncbi:MAG: glutathione peroxidase [Gammaproteobacteria bacterium TMED119]|nr:MAG: glutathione peroxidase [Gammaproteobacteria bacterium TMED119]
MMSKYILKTLGLCIVLSTVSMACEQSLLNHSFQRLASSEEINLCTEYREKVVLVVNTASKCGLTKQYEGLENLYQEYADAGLVVLGFPSNDFFGQEPGTEQEIQDFCKLTYGVKFPMLAKTTVKGDAAHAFYKDLKHHSGTYPQWNFHKYLIGRDGKYIDTFGPRTRPYNEDLIAAIETALAK